MDGQIGEKTDSPALKRYVPDGAVPARPSSEEKEKGIEICYEVTSKLKTSPSSLAMPDKARTVSSTDSSLQKNPHAFDFRFVAHDDEVRQLLMARTGDERRDVTLISHPDDLSQANLVTRLSISGDGRHTLRSGKLFEGSKPLTLVIDIRKLSGEDLPKFNDLLDPDNPCLYDKVSQKKRPLGEHVSVLVVADPKQLASVGNHDDASAAGAPGADFWRRINRPGNTWQFEARISNHPSMAINKVPQVLAEFPSSESTINDNNILINCHLHSHWRQLLMGGPGVDKQGRIQHIPGRLEGLKAGQRVILKGADWQDLIFEQTIRQLLAQQCFESNGKVCQLPDNVQFYQMPVGNGELGSLFQSLSCSDNASGNPIIINQSNISEWLSPTAIAPEGYAIPNTCLLEQVQAGGVVTVTSPLTEALWFRLLGSLQTICKTTGLEPKLQVVHSKQQPEALGLNEHDEHPLSGLQKKIRDHVAVNTATYQQNAQANHWINHQSEAPLVIQVSEQTGFNQLFDNIHIASEQKAHFGRSQSKLQKALTAGKPVVLLGLETNPALQQLLEPLMVGQPLLVNGQLQAYPQAHVTILCRESLKSSSSVFNSMVSMGKPCPEVDLWDINADKHGIPRAELPEQAIYSLYAAFKTVPGNLCNPLPELTEGLLNNLILAARRARQVDQSLQFLPCHWRKAINSVITHGTRQNPSVRDFMKVACWHLLPDKDQAASVDPDRLNGVINSAPRLDREFVEQNPWQLARAFDPAVFNGDLQLSYDNPFPEWDERAVPDSFCAMILAHAPEETQQAMANQLAVDPAAAEQYQSLVIRPSRQIKRLQDALASGWQLPLPLGQTRSDAIQALASDCLHIARGEYVTENPDAERIERIENRLSDSLRPGSAYRPLSAMARDLYHGKMSQEDRESRRLSRLHDRLKDSPVIFLEGETGTGKSYFSAKVAKASGQAAVISLGPSDSEQTLMKRWQWQQHADGDRSMVLQNRALMEWANTPTDKDGHFVTLVVDEANLAKAGLLASLNGLWEPQPCIYVNGHPVKVGPKHRVILTGNPDHYSGRQMDPALEEKLPRVYYPRLDQAFLLDRVVEPALVKHLQEHLLEHQINDIAHSAAKSVMALWQHYQELLPEHEFTPRDLTDICSWVGWYLDRALPARGSVTCEQINSLIQHSFRDVLGPEITETHQDALSALEIWFAARYQSENTLSDKVRNKTLSDIQQTFITVSEKIRPDFDTSGSAVCELVQRLGQDLSRCQQAYHFNRKHDGRQATLIEGPAGRGKDATLNLVIETVKQQAEQQDEYMPDVFYLNACDCSWDKLCEKIQKAKIEGGIVVISEMNLIDSQHLEGELNDILAGEAHPGFHLFATINPPEYSGRKPLSPALKGRFRHLPIRQYNPAELQGIAEKVLPESSEGTFVAKMLTEKHCLLRAHLQRKKLPLQPTSLDLQNVARAITRGGDFSEKAVHQCLNQHYRLYLMAANLSLDELPKSSALAFDNGELDSGLCEWFNRTVPDFDRPWLIRRSDRNSIDEKNHEVRFNTLLDEEDAKKEIIKRVAQAKWQASGLSLKPVESEDMLIQALYRHWQHRWFDRQFGRAGVDANSVFPMTEEQKQTLKLWACQPYLQEADRQISAWNARDLQGWPAFWNQLSDLTTHLVDDFINDASQGIPQVHDKQSPALAQRTDHEPQPHSRALTIDGDKAPEKYLPEDLEEQAPALDRETNYEGLQKPQIDDYIIFDLPNHFTGIYRWWAWDIYVSAEGEVKEIDISHQFIQGAEVLIPARLPEQDQELTLARDQTLATLDISSNNGQFVLPSLTVNDYIVALRTEPHLPFTLIRDRYTGLHTLSAPEAKAGQSIRFAYVVEHRKADQKTPAGGACAERSTRFDANCSEGMKTILKGLLENIDQQLPEIQLPLQRIKNAKDTTQRIDAIGDYCREFSGAAMPGQNVNFLHFLITQRQGSCRHRVPVFIAFCRYFGIPCRQISNRHHAFAECSVDGGQTWESVDLGGSPVEATEMLSVFQPARRVSGSGTESKKIGDLLKEADSAQRQALAEAMGIGLEELNKVLETGSALPATNLSTYNTVLNLWARGDLTGFAMGVSMLLETEALGFFEMKLIGEVPDSKSPCRPMSEAVKQILSKSDDNQVTEQLRLLHSKMINQAGADPEDWLNSIMNILTESNLDNPSVIHFAYEALKSGWLDPLPDYKSTVMEAIEHHQLLVRLEGVDELKARAAQCLKMWYRGLLSRGKNSLAWQRSYKRFQRKHGDKMFVTHSHEGFSPLLEEKMTCASIKTVWTDEPEGTPNIEKMLLHHPAFVKLNSGKANHRPLIILGQPHWFGDVLYEKIEALFQTAVGNGPNSKQLSEKNKLAHLELSPEDADFLSDSKVRWLHALMQAFSHYLYEVTRSKGGCLTYCWGDDANRPEYGAHDPSSPEELYAMIASTFSSYSFENSVKDDYLRQALNTSNALILKPNELTKIADEFLSTMNLNSLCESLSM
ncbi:AAA family ATPase [Endozoicomonas sp. 8E]|uniref:AAA family ATPase n=1 Tax=Endozoicomonas sp. 8E TaxID=3035692 RepID=UPI00293937F2|nr:AAA family ATPase [Endozoicomonas sp. 8E]WOG28883.1 AAA family ATPase [Endozoicomonas sp. 8E]